MNRYYDVASFEDQEIHTVRARHRYVWQFGLSLMGIGILVAIFALSPLGTAPARRKVSPTAAGTLLFWGVIDKGKTCAYAVGANGRDMRCLWPNPIAGDALRDYRCGEALMSPNGRTVLLSLYYRNTLGDKAPPTNNQLLLMSADGTQARTLWQSDRPIADLTFSRDSRQIAFSLDGVAPSIVVLPVDGDTTLSAARRLGAGLIKPQQPAFSHDGAAIVFVAGYPNSRSLYTIDINGSDIHCLAHNIPGASNPTFGPDDRTLIFRRRNPTSASFETLNLATGALQNMKAYDPALQTQLSSSIMESQGECSNNDGRSAIFAVRHTEPDLMGVADVWYARPDGTHLRRLLCGSAPPAPLHDAYFQRLAYSADGSRIACVGGDIFGDSGLCIVGTSGTGAASYIPLPVGGMDVKGISFGA